MFHPEEFDSALDDLEVRLEQLHLLFERFFSGVQCAPPTALREEIDQQLAALLMSQHSLGALARVRLTLFHQRYESYQKSWEQRAEPASGAADAGWRSAARVEPDSQADRTPSVRPDSARTIRDFRTPPAVEGARENREPRPPQQAPSSARASARTQPRVPHPFNADSSGTTPDRRLLSEQAPGLEPRPEPQSASSPSTGLAEVGVAPQPAQTAPGRQMNMDRVREIHARLRAANTRPPSLERLAKRLSETEAELKALHGDRTVTFDVVLRDDGKAVVKPIVR